MTAPYLFDSGLLAGAPDLTGLLGNQPPAVPTPDAKANQLLAPPSHLLPPANAPLAASFQAGPTQQQQILAQPTPPPVNAKRSLLAKVHDALMSGLLAPVHGAEHVAQAVDNSVVGGANPGLMELLQAEGATPEQIKAARPGFLDALFGDKRNGSVYDQSLAQLAQYKQLAAGVTRQRQMLQEKQDFFNQIGAPKSEDLTQDPSWVAQVYHKAVASGWTDTEAALKPIYQELLKPAAGANAAGDYFINKNTHETRSFSKVPGTTIGPEWEKISPAAASQNDLWRDTQTNRYYSLPKTQTPETAGLPGADAQPGRYKPEVTAREEDVQANTSARQDQRLVRTVQTSFQREIKDLAPRAELLDRAYITISRALDPKTPLQERKNLYGSIYSMNTQATDQAKNLRYQLLQYYESHVSPDIASRFDIFLSKLKDGQLPPKILEGMRSHLQVLAQQTKAEIDARKQFYMRANPDLPMSTYTLPSGSDYFTQPGLVPGANGAAPASGGTRTITVNGKTFEIPE